MPSYIVAALAMGFPVVVSLAWIFDVNAGRLERSAPTPGLRGGRLVATLAALALLAAAPGTAWYFVIRRPARPAPGESPLATLEKVPPASEIRPLPSIAVLPLVNLSRDPEQDYFSDGVAEEILNVLAQVEGLHVAGRTSSFSFKGKNEDLRSIGQKLGVGAVLEGSVRKQGDKVRITAQLISVADGFHLWSQNFDRELKDIFAVQEEIARAVVDGLKIKLLPGRGRTSTGRHTASLAAYEQYLLGMEVLNGYHRAATPRGQEALQRAVELDPGYGPAWSGLSLAHALLSDWAPDRAVQRDLQQQALAAANQAVELAPDQAESWTRRGLWRMQMGWDWRGAEEDIGRAIAINPNDVASFDARGRLSAVLGQVHVAIAAALRVTERDRLNTDAWIRLACYHLGSGRTADARAALDVAGSGSGVLDDYLLQASSVVGLFEGRAEAVLTEVERAPRPRSGAAFDEGKLIIRALALHALGRRVGSQRALAELIAGFADFDAYQIAQVEARLGEKDLAFEWLERARRQHDGGMVAVLPNNCSLKCDPLLRGLHGDPRWTAFLEEMNLPPD